MFTIILYFTSFLILMTLCGIIIIPYFFGAPWLPTTPPDVKSALKLCKTKPGEVLCDLGCGDARVLIEGAKNFGLNGIGVEIDPFKIHIAKWRVRREKLLDKIQIIRKNIYKFDYSHVDILFIYLTHQALDRLLPILKKQMKPNARIICYKFCLKGVTPDQTNKAGTIFLYNFNKGTKINSFS